ncbi:hypothetical protein TSOC_008555 [Tetrabaena socialis]|uniref:Protein BOLA4, chloroplastic/mitochondrial n=1 Tax=Tetrabaena socialis TaxID=47790 RepID=A0A2J7ZY03_9CHLO|nr:hypothetical protein TSOC_008555 [Tetrabaena socialis]|eukprot:PNH05148.1 hypothetical protein TSOC_008555 [Tetrabaena socialis]
MSSLLAARSTGWVLGGRRQRLDGTPRIAGRRGGVPSTSPSLSPLPLREERAGAATVARGIPVSGPAAVAGSSGGVEGQMSTELMASMRGKICEALETDACLLTDVYGDGRHVSIDVVSKLFAEKSSMQRQRMVYKAIWLELQEAVHAVDSMTTKTPEEAAAQ